MSNKAQYILFSILDFGLTFGGTAGVIVYNYVSPANTTGFKITLSGILLVVILLFTAKAIFEKSYREKIRYIITTTCRSNIKRCQRASKCENKRIEG